MRFVITVENVETGETEDVLAGLAVLRSWETQHGKPAVPTIQEGYAGPILELGALAYNRKHGKTYSADAFADVYDVVSIVDGTKQAPTPTSPATAPPTL